MTVNDRSLLPRVTRLEARVRHIANSGDLSARVPVARHAALTGLAKAINQLLDTLEQERQEQGRLLQELEQQIGELALRHTTALAVMHSSSLDAALQEIAQSVHDAFKAVNTMVVWREPAGPELQIRASVGIPAEVLAMRRVREGDGIIGIVAQTGQTIRLDNVARDPRYYEADVRTRSELCVPLKAGERVIGVINVESDQVGAFTPLDEQLLQTLAHDLTPIVEGLQLRDELRAANLQLAEHDRLRNRFVAQLSHEIRAPLNAILGFGEVLIEGAPGPLNDEQREYLHYILTSGEHLLALINDILDLSRLQVDRITLERRAASLADIAGEARLMVWPGIQRKNQMLAIEIPLDLPDLAVDPLRIKQVLINLLNNACKFTPQGGRISVRVEPWTKGWVRVSVTDNGPGIPPDRQAEVFEDFSQLDRQQHDLERGTGLGLAIVRRLVELHGGQIWIDSTGQPGEGATFYFTLPLADATTARYSPPT